MNVEASIIQWLNADEQLADCKASADVPASRPQQFLTVELTGGQKSRYKATPLVSIDCYSTSRYKASELAENIVVPRLMAMPYGVSEIADVSIESVYNNPEPGPPQHPRYTINISIVHAI